MTGDEARQALAELGLAPVKVLVKELAAEEQAAAAGAKPGDKPLSRAMSLSQMSSTDPPVPERRPKRCVDTVSVRDLNLRQLIGKGNFG